MRGGTPFRRAVAASVGLHGLLAVGLALHVRQGGTQSASPPPPPGIDTRAPVRVEFFPPDAGPAIDVPVAPPPAGATDDKPPLVRTVPVPQTLPPEVLALARKPHPTPTADVVEVPVTPTPLQPRPPADPATGMIQPAAGTGPPTGRASLDGGAPVHGAIAAGQAVVYVLDASGSMGEGGKFDAARRALIATLRKQPPTVRFQVVVYAGFAFLPLPAPHSGCVPASADNVDRMADALRALAPPAGRSHHAEGLRAALALRPDFVLVLSDAAELQPATVRGALRQTGASAVVCVAKVGIEGVGTPAEVK